MRTSTCAGPSCILYACIACIGQKCGPSHTGPGSTSVHGGQPTRLLSYTSIPTDVAAVPVREDADETRLQPASHGSSKSDALTHHREETSQMKMRDCSPARCLEKSDLGPIAALVVWRGCGGLVCAVALPICAYPSDVEALTSPSSDSYRAHIDLGGCTPIDPWRARDPARTYSCACCVCSSRVRTRPLCDAGPHLTIAAQHAERERRRDEHAAPFMAHTPRVPRLPSLYPRPHPTPYS
jgi:hypothetical protein